VNDQKMRIEYLPVKPPKTDGLRADKDVESGMGKAEGLLKKNEHRTSNVQHRILNGKDVETDL